MQSWKIKTAEKKRVIKIIQCSSIGRRLIWEDGKINMNKCRDVRNKSQARLKVEKVSY